MARLLAVLLVSSLGVVTPKEASQRHALVAGCDEDIIGRINTFYNMDASPVLEGMTGKYDILVTTAFIGNDFMQCPQSTFYKEGDEYKVKNNWKPHSDATLKDGGKTINTVDNGAVISKTYPVYLSPDNTVFSGYACDTSEEDGPAFGYIMKKSSTIANLTSYDYEAYVRLELVGIMGGFPVFPCFFDFKNLK